VEGQARREVNLKEDGSNRLVAQEHAGQAKGWAEDWPIVAFANAHTDARFKLIMRMKFPRARDSVECNKPTFANVI
jgi:hypothetical protein